MNENFRSPRSVEMTTLEASGQGASLRSERARPKHRASSAAIALMLLALALSGCTAFLAKSIALAPTPDEMVQFIDAKEGEELDAMLGLRSFRVQVGRPAVELAVTVIPPRDYGIEYETGTEDGHFSANFRWMAPDKLSAPVEDPNGTVILLPGWYMGRYTLLLWGMGLASQGYRAVLVDLRGQGASTGEYVTFGIEESRDIAQLANALANKGLIEGPLVLFGVSYGAATAIMAAPRMPELDAVVALEPYTNAINAIEGVGRALNPLLSVFVSDERLKEAIAQASRITGHDLQQARPIAAMPKVDVPVLLIHGQDDTWIPPENSIQLFLAKQGPSQLWIIPDAAHMTLPMRYNDLSVRIFDWLEQAVNGPGTKA